MEFLRTAYKKIKSWFIWFFIGGVALAAPLALPDQSRDDVALFYSCSGQSLTSISHEIDKINSKKSKAKITTNGDEQEISNSKARATIKGCEISKKVSKQTHDRSDFSIEIVDIKPIQGGVEVFARAWYPWGEQVGFGTRGTVDIERFVIINPPILIEDKSGSIVRTYTDSITGETVSRSFREDPEQAVVETIAHTIFVKEQKFGALDIERGKIGNTTTTVYPDADTESTSVDGQVYRDESGSGGVAWSTLRGSAGNNSGDSGVTIDFFLRAGTSANQWDRMNRVVTLFDVSSIDSGDTIDSATLSYYFQSTAFQDNFDLSIAIVEPTPASNTALANSDYDIANWSATRLASDLDVSSISQDAYNDFSLNATGLGIISTATAGDGIANFGGRYDADADDSEPTYANQSAQARIVSADTSGTTQDPKLVIEHSGAGAGEEVQNSFIRFIAI